MTPTLNEKLRERMRLRGLAAEELVDEFARVVASGGDPSEIRIELLGRLVFHTAHRNVSLALASARKQRVLRPTT